MGTSTSTVAESRAETLISGDGAYDRSAPVNFGGSASSGTLPPINDGQLSRMSRSFAHWMIEKKRRRKEEKCRKEDILEKWGKKKRKVQTRNQNSHLAAPQSIDAAIQFKFLHCSCR